MSTKIKYVHTNIVAQNWKKLANFYIEVFDCKPVFPERNLRGRWVNELTGLDDANIRGIHLRLPDFENGPTLEIFEYSPEEQETIPPAINKQGFAHIAFHVENVEEITKKIIENGGKKYGEIIRTEIEDVGILTAVYTRDPEGNIVEIQNWEK